MKKHIPSIEPTDEEEEELTDKDEEELLRELLGTGAAIRDTGEPHPLILEVIKDRAAGAKKLTLKKEDSEMAAVATKTKKKEELTGWETFDIAVKHLRVVYIWGPPGVAKTFHSIDLLTQHLHKHVGPDAVPTVTTLNEDKVWQEIMGHYLPTDGGGMKFHLGPAAQALLNGALIVNELVRASGAVLDGMLEVMDGERVAQISMPDGSCISPHKHFKMICTSNSPVTELDPALQDRMQVVIKVNEPHPDTVAALNKGYKGLGDIIRNSYLNTSHAISVRAGFTFAELVKQKVDFNIAGRMAFEDRWSDISTTLKLEA